MAKLAIDARFYGTEHTGLGRYTTNVLSYLPKYLKKHELLVLLRRKYYDTLNLPSNCTKVLFDVPHYSLLEQLLLPLKLRSLHADLLYTFHFNTPVLSACPTVVTVHDLIKSYFSGSDTTTRSPLLYRLKRAGYNYVVRRTLTKAAGVIVPTNTVKNQILANYASVPPERIIPIPEAPDLAFRASAHVKKSRTTLELPDKYLLFVGNAYPHKNLQVLLSAHRLLKDPTLHLVIVSKISPFLSRTLAPYEPRTLHLLPELTDAELVTVYRQARLLVTPSLMEGYGLVGLEALMLGIPVLASNIPVYREVYGNHVTYFDPHSPADLSAALKQALANKVKPAPFTFTRTWDDVASQVGEVLNARCARLRPTQ